MLTEYLIGGGLALGIIGTAWAARWGWNRWKKNRSEPEVYTVPASAEALEQWKKTAQEPKLFQTAAAPSTVILPNGQKPKRTFPKTTTTAVTASALALVAGPLYYIGQHFIDNFQYSWAMKASNIDETPKVTTQDMVQNAVATYMQPQPVHQPSTEDLLRGAANPLPDGVRGRMASVFSRAARLIRETRIRDTNGLNDFIASNMRSSLGSSFNDALPYLRVWNGMANDFARSGQFPTMQAVADFCQGSEQALR